MPDWIFALDMSTARLFYDLDTALWYKGLIIKRLIECGFSHEKATSMYQSYIDDLYKKMREVYLGV